MLIDSENIKTRRNLYDALWHIRLADHDRVMWIDAICINQSDVLERNHQVHPMGQIYSEAQHVIAWLELARNDNDLGMSFLKQWANSGFSSEVWDLDLEMLRKKLLVLWRHEATGAGCGLFKRHNLQGNSACNAARDQFPQEHYTLTVIGLLALKKHHFRQHWALEIRLRTFCYSKEKNISRACRSVVLGLG